MANLIVLYGASQTGKTSYLLKLIEYYQSIGLDVKGILSPAVFHNGEKVGILVKDVFSGEEVSLAARRPVPVQNVLNKLNFIFDDEAINWGRTVLKSALPADVFIVDEIGPLELKMGKGWKEAIGQIILQQYRLCIVVLRESLHELVKDKWPVTEWIEYSDELTLNRFDHYFHQD